MLLEKLKADQLTARKQKNEIATSLLTTLYSESLNVGKNKGNRHSTDDEVISIIKKFIKSANENKDIYTKSNIFDRVEVINKELTILNSYLPQGVTPEEVKVAVLDILIQLNLDKNPSSMGKIMKELKIRFGSTLDGAVASVIIKEILSS